VEGKGKETYAGCHDVDEQTLASFMSEESVCETTYENVSKGGLEQIHCTTHPV